MSYRDNLKYEVIVVQDNGRSKFDCIASFSEYPLAINFMQGLSGKAGCAFDSMLGDKRVIIELYYSTENTMSYMLFKHPLIILPNMKDFPPQTTKKKLAQRLSLGRSFDYALPRDWLSEVVSTLAENNYGDPETLNQKLSYGTVWFYPKEGIGKISGRPAALTSDAEELLIAYTEVAHD